MRNVALNFPNKMFAFVQFELFAVMPQFVLWLCETVNPVLVSGVLHPFQHPHLVHSTCWVILDDLFIIFKLLLVNVQIQLRNVTFYDIHLSSLKKSPSLIKSIVWFPNINGFLFTQWRLWYVNHFLFPWIEYKTWTVEILIFCHPSKLPQIIWVFL